MFIRLLEPAANLLRPHTKGGNTHSALAGSVGRYNAHLDPDPPFSSFQGALVQIKTETGFSCCDQEYTKLALATLNVYIPAQVSAAWRN